MNKIRNELVLQQKQQNDKINKLLKKLKLGVARTVSFFIKL